MGSVFQVMRSLFGSSSGSLASRSVPLGLETLEAREVPAVVSAVIRTNSVGQNYLDIQSNNAASRVTLRHPTASDGWNVDRNTLVVRDEANGFQKTLNLPQAKLSYVSFTGGSSRDEVFSSMLSLGLVADGKGGDDYLRGGAGNDLLKGGDGNDRIEAGSGGNDKLYGGAGNDQLFASSGNGVYCYMEGGTGRDTFYRNNASSVQYRTGNLQDSPLVNLLAAVVRE